MTVETDKLDKYRRNLGKVLVDGVDANMEQVKRGMAWHYRAYMRQQSLDDRLTYSTAEKEAVAAGIGLWQDAKAVGPWVWRHPAKAAP